MLLRVRVSQQLRVGQLGSTARRPGTMHAVLKGACSVASDIGARMTYGYLPFRSTSQHSTHAGCRTSAGGAHRMCYVLMHDDDVLACSAAVHAVLHKEGQVALTDLIGTAPYIHHQSVRPLLR